MLERNDAGTEPRERPTPLETLELCAAARKDLFQNLIFVSRRMAYSYVSISTQAYLEDNGSG